MKKIIVFLALGFSLSKLQAQIISSEIITSNGDFYSNSTAMLSFSEGVVIDDFVFQSISSINETMFVTNSIKIFPNPATYIVNLEVDSINNSDLILEIYNVIGNLVKSEVLKDNNRQINIGDLSNGVYMIEIKSEGWIAKQKLIIYR